jgi:hypothetical protein
MNKITDLFRMVVFFSLFFPPARAFCVMDASREIVLDLTNLAEAQKQARWADPERIDINKKGMGWDGPSNAYRDFWIETTDDIAVGWSWRPVQSVTIKAEVEMSEMSGSSETTKLFYSGQLFARFSCEGLHWSTWQLLQSERSKTKDRSKEIYTGRLSVPNRNRRPYYDLLRKYSKLDVPWKSDEEAAVRWILQKDPGYFEKHTPFVGYVQFLFEISLPGGKRIKSLKFTLNYGTGGLHSPPKDKSIYKKRQGPWRFKLPASIHQGNDKSKLNNKLASEKTDS